MTLMNPETADENSQPVDDELNPNAGKAETPVWILRLGIVRDGIYKHNGSDWSQWKSGSMSTTLAAAVIDIPALYTLDYQARVAAGSVVDSLHAMIRDGRDVADMARAIGFVLRDFFPEAADVLEATPKRGGR